MLPESHDLVEVAEVIQDLGKVLTSRIFRSFRFRPVRGTVGRSEVGVGSECHPTSRDASWTGWRGVVVRERPEGGPT